MRLLALLVLIPSFAFGQGLNVLAPGARASSRTNYAKQSNSLTTSTSATTPWDVYLTTVATVAGAPASVGGGTWAAVTSTGNAGIFYTYTVTTPSATKFLFSVYAAKASGTGSATIKIRFAGNVTACSCSRSDGKICSEVSATATTCSYHFGSGGNELGTDPVRIGVGATLSSATTTVAELAVAGGVTGVSTGTTRFAGAMLEVGKVDKPGKICVTTTTSATCK
jgi:hypothetical protein